MGNFDTCAAAQQQQQSKATGKQEKAGEEEEADLAAAQYHFETALQLMDKLKEEARREGMVDGEVRRLAVCCKTCLLILKSC